MYLLKLFIDMLFPIECIRCGDEGRWLCDYCFSKIKLNEIQICPLCKKEIELGFSCVCTVQSGSGILPAQAGKYQVSSDLKFDIKSQKSWVDIYVTFVNLKENSSVRTLIHKLKYNFVESIAQDLAKIGIEFFKKNHSSLELFLGNSPKNIFINGSSKNSDIIVIPVPLHKRRLLWRGFNQSELILGDIEVEIMNNSELGIKNTTEEEKKFKIRNDIFIRRKNTLFQGKTKMTEKDRKNNMRGSFEVKYPELIFGKTVILFDDVITTGVTVEECARVLKNAGAGKVIAMAVGKG